MEHTGASSGAEEAPSPKIQPPISADVLECTLAIAGLNPLSGGPLLPGLAVIRTPLSYVEVLPVALQVH